MPKIINEVSQVIFSLPWIVARDEGYFVEEGLDIDFVQSREIDRVPGPATDPEAFASIGPHKPFEEGQAAIYRACEWGQIRRAYDSERGGQIVGKRSSIGIQALFSAPESRFTHPQTLRNQPIGVAFHTGSHYATLQMLEGFLQRDEINVVRIGSMREHYEAVKRGELAAVSLMDPWITVAEKEGLQKIIETHYVGSEIASPDVDAESWTKITRALKRAVRAINADKRKYMHYLIDSLPAEYARLITPEDFHLPRIRYVDPEPYAQDEFNSTFDWLVGWGLIKPDGSYSALVDNRVPLLT